MKDKRFFVAQFHLISDNVLSMKKYNLYFFDFDGTIVDSFKSLVEIFSRSFKAVGVEIKAEDCVLYSRRPLEETYKELNAPIEKADIFVKEIRHWLNDDEILRMTELFPDTYDCLKTLYDNGAKLGIVTSNSEKHVKDTLEFLKIPVEWFAIIVGNDQVKETKPSPMPLLYSLEKLNWRDKSSVVYVGDGMNDMISANRAGIPAILIDRINEFEEADNYTKIKTLLDLI